jgi:hypothetical protein
MILEGGESDLIGTLKFLSDQARTAIIRYLTLKKGRFSCLNTPFYPPKQHFKNLMWIFSTNGNEPGDTGYVPKFENSI